MMEALAHPDEVGLYAEAEALAFRGIARVQLKFERLAHREDIRVQAKAPLAVAPGSIDWVGETVRAIQLRVKGRA